MSQIQNTNSGVVLWRVATGIILLALLPIPVRADDYRDAFPPPEVREYFYADDSGFVYRGGIAMRDPFGLHARTLNLADLRLEGPRDLCSMSGLWADYQALFSREFIEDNFLTLVNNVAEAAIWSAFCSAEPVLCDLVKHMRAMARANLSARLAQCHSVQNAAMQYGRSIWEESHKKCLEEKKAEGVAIDQAMEACGAHSISLLDYLGRKVENFDLIGEALQTAGASAETKQFAKDVLGEITFSANGNTTRTGHAAGRIAAKYEQMSAEQESAVLNILNRVHETGTYTEEDLLALSTPSLPMTPRYLLTLARLQDGNRQVAALRLARALAMDRLLTQVTGLQEQLQAARKAPGGEAKAHALEVELRDLERQVADLARYKKLEEELVAHPMLELLREVATEEESTSTQVNPGGAAERSTQSGQRLQDNLGSFSDVVGPNSESGF